MATTLHSILVWHYRYVVIVGGGVSSITSYDVIDNDHFYETLTSSDKCIH